MPSPPIQLFLTSIALNPVLRKRQEFILRVLQVKNVPFTSYDLASDEVAKKLWKRKVPLDKQQLPGLLVGGKFPGTAVEFEEAVEYGELDLFLRLKEDYKPDADDERDGATLTSKPIGVPGASSPQQMTNQKPSYAAKPSPLKNKDAKAKEVDAGEVLEDAGLQGVKVTDEELADLVKELGLEGDEAGDLVRGLSLTAAGPAVDSQEKPSASKNDEAAGSTDEKVEEQKEEEEEVKTATKEPVENESASTNTPSV